MARARRSKVRSKKKAKVAPAAKVSPHTKEQLEALVGFSMEAAIARQSLELEAQSDPEHLDAGRLHAHDRALGQLAQKLRPWLR